MSCFGVFVIHTQNDGSKVLSPGVTISFSRDQAESYKNDIDCSLEAKGFGSRVLTVVGKIDLPDELQNIEIL